MQVDGFTGVGVAFYRLLSYIAEEYDLSQALTSVVSMYSKIRVGESLSVDTITAFLKRNFPKANAGRILGLDSEYDERRQAVEVTIGIFMALTTITYLAYEVPFEITAILF
ncbi:unnamed protein product [Boreogadus saida]